MKFGVVVFPGSNCDHDTYHVISKVLGQPVKFLWHQSATVDDCDTVILPGGFAYGDYLRSGAIAQFSPIMTAIKEFAGRNGIVLGICNGFQILCEAGLLPGTLRPNTNLQFICEYITVRLETTDPIFTNSYQAGQILNLPIAHATGNYYCDAIDLAQLQQQNRVLLRYCNPQGNVTTEANPNGSLANIAGILNSQGNILGLMPHPERASDELLGSTDGRVLFHSLSRYMTEKARQQH
jgi:phosphoribosylformylglycinamidine synthase subunit PurQ / glutaminase